MKNYFTILLKSPIIRHAQRLAIVCVLLSLSNVAAIGGNTYYAKCAVRIATGAGNVYVKVNDQTDPSAITFSSKSVGVEGVEYIPSVSVSVGATASEGYDCEGWNTDGTTKVTNSDLPHEFSVTPRGKKAGSPKPETTYYFFFKPIISIDDANAWVSSKDIAIVRDAAETTTTTHTIYLYNATDYRFEKTETKNVTFDVSKDEPKKSGPDNVTLTINVTKDAIDGEKASIAFYSTNNGGKAAINVIVEAPPTITFSPPTDDGCGYKAELQNTTGVTYKLGKNRDGYSAQTIPVEVESQNDRSFALTAYPSSNHRFYRWVITNGDNVSYLYKELEQSYEAKNLDNVTAEFVTTDYAIFMVKDNDGKELSFNDLQGACDEASGKINKIVYVKKEGRVKAENYTIPSGVTLLVPGDDTNTCLTQTDNGAGSSMYLTAWGETLPSHDCKKYISLDEGTNITVNGAICVYAKLGGEMGYNGVPFDHGKIIMNKDCEIRLKDRSKLFAYGYIVNADKANGQVVAEYGAEVYEAVQIRDWRGGSATTSIVGMDGQGDGTKVFPFGQYYVQNIESKLILQYGASAYISTAVNMTGAGLLPLNVPFMIPYTEGISGMVCMHEGSQLTKWYASTTDQLYIEFQGNSIIDQIVLPLAIQVGITMDVVISSGNYVLPFNSNMSFNLIGANLVTKKDVLFFPGTIINIDANSKLTIEKNMYLYDLDQFPPEEGKAFFYTAPTDMNILPLTWTSTGIAPTRTRPTKDATLVVDGKVTINGALYTTSSGANITSNGGGEVQYYSVGDLTTTNQKWQDPNASDNTQVSNITIKITNAKLHNDKEKYDGDEYVTVSGTGKYTYDANQGRWATGAEAGISETVVPSFEMKKHATSVNTLSGEIVCTFYKPDNVSFDTNDFQVVKTSGDNFTLGSWELKSDGKLYIPITYTQQNKHGNYEAVFTLTDNHTKLELNTPIRVTAIENYQPAFTTPEEFQISSTVKVANSLIPTITPKTDNIAEQVTNEFMSWSYQLENEDGTEYQGSEFTFEYGIDNALLSDAKVTFIPNSVGEKRAVLRLIATYDEDKNAETPNLLAFQEITLIGNASLNPNTLEFENFTTMFVGDTRTLFADMGNHANSTTQLTYDGTYATIDIAQNKITANKAGTITVQASQTATSSHKSTDKSIIITIYPTEQWNWSNLYYGSTHTNPVTTNAASWTLALADDNSNEVKDLVDLRNESGNYIVTIGEPANVSNMLTAKFTFTSGEHTSTYTATLSGLRHLPACVDNQARYNALEYGRGHQYETNFIKNVVFDDANDCLSFTSHTAETSIWTMQFLGTPDKIAFTPSGSRNWHFEESADALSWSNVDNVGPHYFVPDQAVSLPLKPTTRFVRITYSAGEENIGTLTSLCVTKLAISTSTNKLYLPISEGLSKTIKLTHIENTKPAISVLPAEGLNYIVSDPVSRDGVYETTVTLSATVPQEYTLTAIENGAEANVTVVAYTFPQGLPIRSSDWTGDKQEYYHFYAVESSYAAWDATNNRIVLQNPSADHKDRSITFAFEGGPSIVSFTFSAEINLSEWKIEESVDGTESSWRRATGTCTVNETSLIQELDYTTRYVRLTYNGGQSWVERYVTNLVIEGYPKVVITPSELELNETDKEKTFVITAINLQNINLQVDNDNFTLQHGSSDAAKSISLTKASNLYPDALGVNKVGDITIKVNWEGKSIVNAGEITITNPDDNNAVLGTVQLLGAKSAITLDDADKTGIWTGVPDGKTEGRPTSAEYTLEGKQFAAYTYRPIDVSNAFLQDASKAAIFDYLFVYGETTTIDGSTTITTPTQESGSNAQTPYYIYKKGVDGISYEFVEAVENANSPTKTKLNFADAATTTDEEGHTYYSIKPATGRTELSIYVTGFCPYATTGYTKYDEGVWYIQGNAGQHVHIYLEDCHIYSRNKTERGNNFVGRQGNVFTEKYVRGSGGVFVFECLTKSEILAEAESFHVSIHTRGNNLLKSNYGCFFNLMGDLRAFQVSSPIQVHLASDKHLDNSKVTLNFDDVWQVANTTAEELDYIRTNGFLSLQKQVNNAPSIDLGNEHTIVNFWGGRVELQNAAIVSTNYKTTLAISHRSGTMGAVGLNILLAYGMGTDATGGTVNFYDGTTSVIPMTVPEEYRGYYLMDTDETGAETDKTSCLRCPKQTYVYGGSHGMLRACRSVTSRGGAPTDGPDGKALGKYEYTLITLEEGTRDEIKDNGLAIIRNFPNEGLKTYYENAPEYINENAPGYLNKTYGLQSVAPIENKLYFWIPENYGYDVTPERDATLTTWRTCMTEISASYAGKTAGIGGDLEIESDEVVKYLLYCQIDKNIHDVISKTEKQTVIEWNDEDEDGEIDPGEEKEVLKDVHTYEAMVKDPTGQLGDDYFSIRPTTVGNELQNAVTNGQSYKVTDRVYYITTAQADTWMNFTAPFDVENIYVMETYDEAKIVEYFANVEPGDESKYSMTAKFQAEHNADFAAFFAMAMALGSDKPFEYIYNQYIEWAMLQDQYTGSVENYTTRGMTPLVHYDGTNFPTSHFYLYKNDVEDWTTTDTKFFTTRWDVVQERSNGKLLEKGSTYSMLFPYALGVGMQSEREFWDYWTGKFLIFESTLGSQTAPHEIDGSDEALQELSASVEENHAKLSGNKSLAQFNTEREDVYLYNIPRRGKEQYVQNEKEDVYDESTNADLQVFPTIEPTTTFLIVNLSDDGSGQNLAPARRITRTGQIIYDTTGEGNGNGTTGGNIPTVGGGNDLFITKTANGINIAVAAPQQVRVISSTGAVLYSGMVQTSVDVAIPATGVYVVTGENEVQKILY